MNATSIIIADLSEENINRILFRLTLYQAYYKNDVAYLFVLYGPKNEQLEHLISDLGCSFIYSEGKIFNSSFLRNEGLKRVTTKYVLFEDLDLFHDEDFYKKISQLQEELENSPYNFFSVPVAYLSENISLDILKNNLTFPELKNTVRTAVNYDYSADTEILQHFIPMSSLILTKTSTALFVGGFDEKLGHTWGGEDRDFIFRLLAVNTKLILPKDFSYTSTENGFFIHKYVGWKSLWVMSGDFVYDRDIISYHLYHEPRKWKKQVSANFNFASDKAKAIGTDYFHSITPLQPQTKPEKQHFIIGRNPHLMNEALFEYLGGFIVLEDHYSIEKSIFLIKQHTNIGKIIFWNPYGNEKRLELFQTLKGMGYETIVAERGALPETIIFDPTDLCVYSSYYKRELWDKSLTPNELEQTQNYIDTLTQSNLTLEKNAAKLSADILKIKLGLHKFEYVLLVCFQLDDDTVTNTAYESSYQSFIEQIHLLSENLPSNCILLYKNHPLSNYRHEINNAVCVDNYHIHDLLECASYLIVYNSGVGVLAQAFGVFAFTFGPAFYGDPYFNCSCKTYLDVLNEMHGNHRVNKDKVLLFYFWLLENCYSYCSLSDPIKRIKEKSSPVYYKRISYYSLKLPGMPRSKNGYKGIFNPEKSILYKRFFHLSEERKIARTAEKQKVARPAEKQKNVKQKLRKFFKNPYAFFNDSKKWWRVFKIFFKK